MFTGTFSLRPGTKMNTDNRIPADIHYMPNNWGGSSCGQLYNIMKMQQDNQLLVKQVHARCRTIFQGVVLLHYCLHITMRRGGNIHVPMHNMYNYYVTLQMSLCYQIQLQ